ncbi:MAG: response regulator [Caldilineales bacterium]
MRVLLADDQDRVRYALRALLTLQTDTVIAAEAVNVAELLDLASLTNPDLILVDWELPGLAMSAALPVLHRLCPASQIVVLSGIPEARVAALAAGADAFVSKGQSPERLLNALSARRAQLGLPASS